MEMKINKHDIFLIAGILSASVLLLVAGFFAMRVRGASVVISVDGSVYGTYPLGEDRVIPVQTDHGSNVIVIEDGSASMQEADCPDKYCERQGSIKNAHQTIICLPHKLVVEVVGENQGKEDTSTPDVVAY